MNNSMVFYPQPRPHVFRYELTKTIEFRDEQKITAIITMSGDKLNRQGELVAFLGHLENMVKNKMRMKMRINVKGLAVEKMAEEIYKIVDDYLASLSNRPYCLQVLVWRYDGTYAIFRPKKVGVML